MSIKNLLIEMKNLSELMVDLAYSAILFNSKAAAEEVIALENEVNSMNYEIKKESLVAARSYEDAEKLTALLEIAEAAESIANAAKDLADLVITGFKPHPVFKMVMEESDKSIVRVVIDEKSDLANKKVGAQSESSAVTAMEKEEELYSSFNGGSAITFEDNNQALMDLEAGRIDAVVADEILVRYYLSLKGEEKFKILDDNFGEEEYGVGIRKGDTEMVDDFNKAYKEMQEDGTLQEISEKWFNEDITIKSE